ncbi:hypothetical protein J7K43_08545 [Candidatus Calescamantes bacterium]|nr:hypothetical protein [Candidatus Calescamantes bacterium]
MVFEDLIREGLIEKTSVNLKRTDKSIKRTRKDLTTAKANLSIDEEWAYTIAYHGMLRVGRALMLAEIEKLRELEKEEKGTNENKAIL